jgi:hypothetical protein
MSEQLAPSGGWRMSAIPPLSGDKQTSGEQAKNDANDAVDGAHSAASKCHRVVALEQTTLRGAVHGRG